MQKEPSVLEKNCNELADEILAWYEEKVKEKYHMRDIYNQLARSATSIGANVAESKFAQSDADYKGKMHIALKEASETRYWIARMVSRNAMNSAQANTFSEKLETIIRILVSICKK